MDDKSDVPPRRRFNLRDVSGTTIALTSLALLSAAAVVTTPVWLWYRRKRKRTDALLRKAVDEARRPEPIDKDQADSSDRTPGADPR